MPNADYQEELTLGMDDLEASYIILYPNPVSNRLFVQVSDKISTTPGRIELLSITGAVLRSKSFSGNTNLNVGDLSAGVYILRYINGKGDMILKKFVKN